VRLGTRSRRSSQKTCMSWVRIMKHSQASSRLPDLTHTESRRKIVG
jgi:hypothetical protein